MLTPLMICFLLTTAVIEDKYCERCGFINLYKTYPPHSKELDFVLDYAIERVNKSTRNVHERVLTSQKKMLHEIVKRESGGNPQAQNKRSTAYGSWQFLNSTWKSVGIKKTSCISCQSEGGILYTVYRYKTPSRAIQHHNRKGWY